MYGWAISITCWTRNARNVFIVPLIIPYQSFISRIHKLLALLKNQFTCFMDLFSCLMPCFLPNKSQNPKLSFLNNTLSTGAGYEFAPSMIIQ